MVVRCREGRKMQSKWHFWYLIDIFRLYMLFKLDSITTLRYEIRIISYFRRQYPSSCSFHKRHWKVSKISFLGCFNGSKRHQTNVLRHKISYNYEAFLGSGPKCRCPVGHRGEFLDVRTSVRPYVPPEAPLRPQISDFEKLAKTLIFGQKWPFFDQNGPKRPKRDFSGEIRKCHFRRIGKPQLCAKNQNFHWEITQYTKLFVKF